MLARLNFNAETLRELLEIALPMVISQGAFAVMIFTDRYFMSQIDPVHMAAALGGGVACFFSFCFFFSILLMSNSGWSYSTFYPYLLMYFVYFRFAGLRDTRIYSP